MDKYKLSFKHLFQRLSITAIDFLTIFTLIYLICSLLACAEKKMSVKEAKKVTVAMSKEPFVPPPRRIDDILNLLEQPGYFDLEITEKHKKKADTFPPLSNDSVTLSNFYFKRGNSARELGRSKQALEDLRIALQYSEREDGQKIDGLEAKRYAAILTQLGNLEYIFGNFSRAVALQQKALTIHERSQAYFLLTVMQLMVGDFKSAEKTKDRGILFCNNILKTPKISLNKKTWSVIHKADMQVRVLEAKGKYVEAEQIRRDILTYMKHPGRKTVTIRKHPRGYFIRRHLLARNLRNQGRYVEAELELRETLKESIGLSSKSSETNSAILLNLGMVYFSQGRVNDAEAIIKQAYRITTNSGISRSSSRMGTLKMYQGLISIAQHDFNEAMYHYDDVKESMSDNHYFYENYLSRSHNLILSLIMTDRIEEGIELISRWYDKLLENFGKEHYETVELIGLRGMVNARNGNDKQALKDLSEAVPVLLSKQKGYKRSLRLKIIVEAYLELLTKFHHQQKEKVFGKNISEEIFKLCELINGSLVKMSLGASGARAAAVNPELADLVRREQDASKQIDALKQTLSNVLAAPYDQVYMNSIADLKAAIDSLSQARNTILDEIKNRFPKYDEFVNPPSPGFETLKTNLRTEEVLIVIHPNPKNTFVWAIPKEGSVAFTVAPLGKTELQNMANRLRYTLASVPGTFSDIPDYDFTLAHELFTILLNPVKTGWRKAKDLIIVASPPVGLIPFSVIPTEPVKLSKKDNLLFGNYRKVPWLIRKHSITRLPSASSLITLRSIPEGDPNRRTFLGFGDPYFNLDQMAKAKADKNDGNKVLEDPRVDQLSVRSIRLTGEVSLDSDKVISSNISMLERLPDTAEEIISIAKILGADPTQDIFLGEKATEKQVKSIDMSNRKVVAFATHGLIPGDLDGLYQPALAMCSPTVAKDDEDGLLTRGEILKLRMNADWVVLSACNTGAADGAGAEAVSGLGRAFFYAGSRALLVSMWRVESTSAKQLTTGLFYFQNENPTLSKAKALQKSILHLIDKQVVKDDSSGKIVASYAHPFFWAPFIVVGDGR